MAWEEKVASRSGRSCCIMCQKVPLWAVTREKDGASQMLLLKTGTGWKLQKTLSGVFKKT